MDDELAETGHRPRRARFFLAIHLVAALSLACDTALTRYESIKHARADKLFERGWVPDVLPDDGGPLVEVHDWDTNDGCAIAQFSAADIDGVLTALSRKGFERYSGPFPSSHLSCPFEEKDLAHAPIRFRRRNPSGVTEYAAIDRRGKFLFSASPWF
jgi:hypothetical protein